MTLSFGAQTTLSDVKTSIDKMGAESDTLEMERTNLIKSTLVEVFAEIKLIMCEARTYARYSSKTPSEISGNFARGKPILFCHSLVQSSVQHKDMLEKAKKYLL